MNTLSISDKTYDDTNSKFMHKVSVNVDKFVEVFNECEKCLGKRWLTTNPTGVWRCYLMESGTIDYFFINVEDAVWFKLKFET